jgi:site-specific DNA-methyltransferase (adenine-specific)
MINFIGKIFNRDCIETMAELPNECIDLIVTDPPYFMNYKTNRRKNKNHKFCSVIQNDNNIDLLFKILPEFYRILKNNSAIYIYIVMPFQLICLRLKLKNILI